MRYLQADRKYMIHPETFEFLYLADESSYFELDVPFYLWNMEGPFSRSKRVGLTNDGVPVYGWFRKVYKFQLNQLEIEFIGNQEYATIKFADRVREEDSRIELCAAPVTYLANTAGGKFYNDLRKRITGGYYRYIINGVGYILRRSFGELRDNGQPRFQGVRRLSGGVVTDTVLNRLYFGISPEKFTILYKGNKVGRSLALLCGVWAILLTDDLRFDSLVALNEVRQTTLSVQDFLYTVNKGHVRAQMLLR